MRWSVVVAVVACNCESGPGTTRVESVGVEMTAQTPTTTVEQMRAHYAAATDLQKAISHGRLIEARELAAWIGTNARPRTDELMTASYQLEQARDLRTAAALTGDLAGACGSCHQERGAHPALKAAPEPVAVPGIEAQMQRHQWAATRLWDGVIGPDDAAWFAGARAMANATIDLGATTHAQPNSDVVGYAESLRELALRAGDTRDLTARSVQYGEMLYTCASCHAIVRPRAVADRDGASR